MKIYFSLIPVLALSLIAPRATAQTTAAPTTAAPTTAGAPSDAEPGTLDSIFNRDLPDAIGGSKINFEWRPRYEYADSQGTKPSNALTMRTVLGLTTSEIFGFQGMIEALNVTSLGWSDSYFSGQNPSAAGKTIIADPDVTELNQFWLRYAYTNWATAAKAGNQLIKLDNERFVGPVGWRQNPQSFESVRLDNSTVAGLDLNYTYIWRVNRIFGNNSGMPAGQQDFKSRSHVIHATYASCDYAKLVGYIYLLDLWNDAGAANSCATYGLSATGGAPVGEKIKLDYRAEFAWQTDYADSPLSYSAPYLHLTLGTKVKPVNCGLGYELLGSDNNAGVRTPLATAHAFNGWADVFLVTPDTGLQDIYVWAGVQLPWEVPMKVVLHKFDAAAGGSFNYGNELDVILSRKFGKHWTVLLKYAYYNAHNAFMRAGGAVAPNDVQRFWAQVDFKL